MLAQDDDKSRTAICVLILQYICFFLLFYFFLFLFLVGVDAKLCSLKTPNLEKLTLALMNTPTINFKIKSLFGDVMNSSFMKGIQA